MRLCVSISWGLFLACSWTWCIGMYLPVLMIQRWGWWGFIAFAVPNVIGCTAFGYVVRTRTGSEALIARYGAAMTWFSVVTVAYHIFFVVFLFSQLIAIPNGWAMTLPITAAAIVLGLGIVFSFLPDRDWLGLALLVYAVSVAAFAGVGIEPLRHIGRSGEQKFAGLVGLIPVLLFGFLLCPYLDLTFHRAIQRSPSRHAFAVFGATFFVMILLTCTIWFWPNYNERWLPGIALGHILAQTIFTVGAHLREVRVSPAISDTGRRWLAMLAPLAAAPLLFIGRLATDSPRLGENLYIALLSLFGIMFPAWFAWRALRAPSCKQGPGTPVPGTGIPGL